MIPVTVEGEIYRRKLRCDYGEYVAFSNPGFCMTHFHRYLCDKIQEFLETPTDNPMDILLLSVPPRHGKSFTVTETLPSWYLGKHPDGNVIIASYEGTFAESFSRRNRDKFNAYASEVFGINGNDKVQGVALWETEKGGRCRAAGLKGGITGFGADLFIIDDPIKNKESADSETVLAKIHDEMGPSVQSRIHPGGKLIVIQTRWVENDVIAGQPHYLPEPLSRRVQPFRGAETGSLRAGDQSAVSGKHQRLRQYHPLHGLCARQHHRTAEDGGRQEHAVLFLRPWRERRDEFPAELPRRGKTRFLRNPVPVLVLARIPRGVPGSYCRGGSRGGQADPAGPCRGRHPLHFRRFLAELSREREFPFAGVRRQTAVHDGRPHPLQGGRIIRAQHPSGGVFQFAPRG